MIAHCASAPIVCHSEQFVIENPEPLHGQRISVVDGSPRVVEVQTPNCPLHNRVVGRPVEGNGQSGLRSRYRRVLDDNAAHGRKNVRPQSAIMRQGPQDWPTVALVSVKMVAHGYSQEDLK